jgi:transglutaminase-like putative cysteine protease
MTTQAIPLEEVKIGEGASTAALLALLLLSVTGSVAAANWADGLGILAWAAMGGLALGIALAKIRLRGLIAHPLMLALGGPAVAVFATSLLPNGLTFEEKLIVLQERFWVWISKVIVGGVSSDNLIFVIQLAFLTWWMAHIAAWFVYCRHQVWGAILPTGAAILLNLFYAAPQSGIYFGLFILSALLLLIRLNLHTMERWWRGASIGYAGDISIDFLAYGVLFSLLLMMLAWLLPAAAPGPAWLSILEPLQAPWQNVEDQFSRVFSALRAVARPAPATFFGTTLTMGGPVQLGQRPVMDIKTDTGRYWRATVYDKYIGIGWINTHLDTMNLGANDPRLNISGGALRVEVTQTVKIFLPDQNILYAQAQPIRFNLPTEIRYGQPPLSDPSAPMLDLALVRARRPLREGDTYTVISRVSVADEDSLRAAPQNYSAWITATYLQLPDNLPQRVRVLAERITAKYSTPYDKATAIEQYLRTNIKYNDRVSAPPPTRDGVDYTLFDRPEGYCNYYASVMAVLARSVGIPARVASGYSLGEYKDGAFHVVEANAHSWPELYFPGYGWVEFEPTANKPEIQRPKKPAPAPENPDLDESAAEARRKRSPSKDLEDLEPDVGGSGLISFALSFWRDPQSMAFAGGGLFALLAIGALTVAHWKHVRQMARLAPAARAYEEMLERACWLGVGEQKHATPFERARAIGAVLPAARREAERVAALYARERFGARTLNGIERAALANAWDQWRAEWRRAFIARGIQRVTAPLRAWVRTAQRFVKRARAIQ